MEISNEQFEQIEIHSSELFNDLHAFLNDFNDAIYLTKEWSQVGLIGRNLFGKYNIYNLNHVLFDYNSDGSEYKMPLIEVRYNNEKEWHNFCFPNYYGYVSEEDYDGAILSLQLIIAKICFREVEDEVVGFFGNKKKIVKNERYIQRFICFPFMNDFSDNLFCPNEKYYDNMNEFIQVLTSENIDKNIIDIVNGVFNVIKTKLNTIQDVINANNNTVDLELMKFDTNSNGIPDKIEINKFSILLQKNQNRIIEIDKSHIHKFVQLSNFLNSKKNNIQTLFLDIKNSNYSKGRKNGIDVFKNEIESYENLIFHSTNMIVSLATGDLITFYELYEAFDKLGMFRSSWENEVSESLLSINNNLESINYSIYSFEHNVVNALNKLTYVTQSSFDELNTHVKRQLFEIRG